VRRRRVWQCGRSSHEPLDLGGERGDLPSGEPVFVNLADQAAAARRLGEGDALLDRRPGLTTQSSRGLRSRRDI
jgi:hypothetical protein